MISCLTLLILLFSGLIFKHCNDVNNQSPEILGERVVIKSDTLTITSVMSENNDKVRLSNGSVINIDTANKYILK